MRDITVTAQKFGDRVRLREKSAGCMPLMLRVAALVLGLVGFSASMAAAQDAPQGSECLAMAQAPPRVTPVSLRRLSAKADDVTITYAGHSTYTIDTPGGGLTVRVTMPALTSDVPAVLGSGQ